jgi:hypothetical protein
MPHALQIFTMSSSSVYFSSGDASYSSSSSYFNTLLHGSNIKKHKDTLSKPEDILSQPKDALLHFVHNLPRPPSSQLLHEYAQSHMPPRNRSPGHNVHIFDTCERYTSIIGLVRTEGVTNANLYTIIEIFILSKSEYVLQNESDMKIEKNASLLLLGNYYIDSCSTLFLNNSLV